MTTHPSTQMRLGCAATCWAVPHDNPAGLDAGCIANPVASPPVVASETLGDGLPFSLPLLLDPSFFVARLIRRLVLAVMVALRGNPQKVGVLSHKDEA